MPKFLKNIECNIIESSTGVIRNDSLVLGKIGEGDYIRLFHFTGFLVDISMANSVVEYISPKNYGFKNNNTVTELNISY